MNHADWWFQHVSTISYHSRHGMLNHNDGHVGWPNVQMAMPSLWSENVEGISMLPCCLLDTSQNVCGLGWLGMNHFCLVMLPMNLLFIGCKLARLAAETANLCLELPIPRWHLGFKIELGSQWEFQEPKPQVLFHIDIFCGVIPLHSFIGLICLVPPV